MTNLFKVENGDLVKVQKQLLNSESQLENWISKDPSIIGMDLLVIGCQITTDFMGKIDILAMDSDGALVILELKRDKTPREIVAQTLDYASWVATLTTNRILEIAEQKLGKRLFEAFQEKFGIPLPEILNSSHSMVIVASEFDASSKRIVEYLSEEHDVNINTAFFNVFELNNQTLLATDWLMDQQEVEVRAESRKNRKWTGYYYVNAGIDPNYRLWEDMINFGFISAGFGRQYSQRLERLQIGDPIYVYHSGHGYIGYGIVRSTSVKSTEFQTIDGIPLDKDSLRQPELLHHGDDDELADYLVGVNWETTFDLENAKSYSGIFSNQNIVCKLRDHQTLEFLANEFQNHEVNG